MDVREKLVELIDDFIHNVDLKHWYSEELDEKLADDLIANGVTVQEWISVKDRLPEESGVCLVYTARGMVMEMDYSAKYKQFNMYDDGIGTPIACTHWMYMPQPPKGE